MSEFNFSMNDETKKVVSMMMEQAATKAVENYVNRQNEINNSKKDRRYQNTELLLKNYYNLKKHVEESIDRESMNFNELFDVNDIDEKDKIFLSSIFRTRRRTKVMMDHVDKCLENYKKMCESSKKESEIRKYKVIELLYLIEGGQNSWDNICDYLNIGRSTLNDTRKKAIKDLSTLIFGVDSLGLY